MYQQTLTSNRWWAKFLWEKQPKKENFFWKISRTIWSIKSFNFNQSLIIKKQILIYNRLWAYKGYSNLTRMIHIYFMIHMCKNYLISTPLEKLQRVIAYYNNKVVIIIIYSFIGGTHNVRYLSRAQYYLTHAWYGVACMSVTAES